MISKLELRHIIESGLMPLSCRCTVNSDSSLTVEISDPGTLRPNLTVTGIASDKLTTSRAISDLVGSLRQDFNAMKGQIAEGGLAREEMRRG